MQTSPCPSREDLLAYVRCALPETDADVIAEHLEQCVSCEETVASLERDSDTIISRLRRGRLQDDYQQEADYGRMMSHLLRSASATDSQATDSKDRLPAVLPQVLGEYELTEVIGTGGMGFVYKARQIKLDRIVAIKTIRSGQLATPMELRRFQVEARAAASLQHPNIVAIHDVGEDGGQQFYAMDFVEGPSLSDLLRDGAIPIRTAVDYMLQLAEAVAYAHQNGVVHRDLKPSNIISSRTGQLIITDFGLAKSTKTDFGLTHSGQFFGTPSYASPEQASGKLSMVGPASDIYSLGAVLYALLTGRPPFRGENSFDTLQEVREKRPVPVRVLNAKVPRDLETICLKCLEKEPAQRYCSAAALADDLRRFLAAEPILARRASGLSHAWRFCRHPNRIRDAGAISIFVGIALFAWHTFAVLMLVLKNLLGIPFPLHVSDEGEFLTVMIGFDFVFLLVIVVGYKVLARQLAALWMGILIVILLGVFVLAVLTETVRFDLGGVLTPEMKTALFLLWSVLIAIMLAIYSAALVAYYSNRVAIEGHEA